MKNNYILCKMKNNCLMVKLDTELPLHARSINALAKIDTGCGKTSIPLASKKFMIDEDTLLYFKKSAIDSGLSARLSFGVSDNYSIKCREKELFDNGDFLKCNAVNFQHNVPYFSINDYILSDVGSVMVSYNRGNNILIGMDILEKLDFHCGYSKVLNNYIFIGVLRTQEDKSDYYRALEEHFGILSNSKDVLYQDFIDENTKNEASGFFAWLKNRHKN